MSTVVSEAAMGVQVLNSPSCRAGLCALRWVTGLSSASEFFSMEDCTGHPLRTQLAGCFVIPVCAQKSGLIVAGPGAEA